MSRPATSNRSSGVAVLLFDGDCGFCTWSVNQMQRFVRPAARVAPWQFTDVAALGVSEAQCAEAVQWVAPDGSVLSGGRAVAALLRSSPWPWPLVGAIASMPGLAALVDALYRLVARNRYRLPGSTPACAVAAPAQVAEA